MCGYWLCIIVDYILQVFAYVDDIFPVLLKVLTHQSDEVVIADLYVLAEVAGTGVPAGECQMR